MNKSDGIAKDLKYLITESNEPLNLNVERDHLFGRKIKLNADASESYSISEVIDGLKLIDKSDLSLPQLKKLENYIETLNREVVDHSPLLSKISLIFSRLSSLNSLKSEVETLVKQEEELPSVRAFFDDMEKKYKENQKKEAEGQKDKTEYKQEFSTNQPHNLEADYAVMGLPFGANQKVLKAAFYKLSRERHPDRQNGNTEKFQELNNAYDHILEANHWTR
jgi:hypothetical protein